jgi:hypothetical protein
MSAPTLTPEQKDWLEQSLAISLNNFRFASDWVTRVLTLRDSATGHDVPIWTRVELCHGHPSNLGPIQPFVELTSDNVGFIAMPSVNMAIMDVRRSLPFFGVTFKEPSDKLVQCKLKNPRIWMPGAHGDDLGIEAFMLPVPTPGLFLSSSARILPDAAESALLSVFQWSNKQLAHFTTSQPNLVYGAIRDSCNFMLDAYQALLYGPLDVPFPLRYHEA